MYKRQGYAFEVYAFALMLSSLSLPTAVSKLVSARMAMRQRRNAFRVFLGSLVFSVIVGVLASLIVFFGADMIAANLMKSPLSAYALRVLAVGLFVVALLGVLRGYFQGLGTMMPTAVSQIIEPVSYTHLDVYKRQEEIRNHRISLGVEEAWEGVHVSGTPDSAYYYSTYNGEDKNPVSTEKPKIMILGGGPNRIGQGIEFDYCCVHASLALKKLGFETIIVNCNPETVSTDYDTSDKLYFEPLTLEDVLSIYKKEKPVGVIAQFGGQTPLNLAADLEKNGVKILGTAPSVIDLAEDRDLFRAMMEKLEIPMPE